MNIVFNNHDLINKRAEELGFISEGMICLGGLKFYLV